MQQIGRYRIERELGRGAMGVAYLAVDPAIGRPVVIKTIRILELAEAADRLRLRDRLLHEARSAGILSHPGIVTIYDVAEEGELAYIAMEFVNGPTLEQLLNRDQPLEPGVLFRILRETASALDYAHKKGIVHRDIKPANIMIDENGAVKITDFGIAKIPASQLATQAGLVLGTPSYMSPEQALGRPVDGRSDQFSLAVIAYEMLTGEKPFAAEEVPSLVYKIAHEPPPHAHSINATLGWPVDVVLRRALEKGPAARFATCAEFVTALESACRSCKDWKPLPRGRSESLPTVAAAPAQAWPAPGEQGGPLSEPPRRRAGPRKDVVVTAFVAILTIGLISLILIWLLGRDRSPARAPQNPEPPAAIAAQDDRPSPAGPAVQQTVEEPAPLAAGAETPTEEPLPATKPARPPAQPAAVTPSVVEETVVTLRTSPAGASVILNGDATRRCTAPCAISLPPGRYSAAATLDGYRTALRIFTVPQEPDISLSLVRMTGQVRILSLPPGAAIFVNGQKQAQATPATLELPVGKHMIAVAREGFARSQQEIEVKDNAFLSLSFTLGQ